MFTTGMNVVVNGRLFRGAGVVEAVCETPIDAHLLDTKFQRLVNWSETFPLVWVRTADGRLIRYNADDIDNGVIAPAPVAPAAPAPVAEPITRRIGDVTITITFA